MLPLPARLPNAGSVVPRPHWVLNVDIDRVTLVLMADESRQVTSCTRQITDPCGGTEHYYKVAGDAVRVAWTCITDAIDLAFELEKVFGIRADLANTLSESPWERE
jgi:hypothetical protein